jgi:hypothetical protein
MYNILSIGRANVIVMPCSTLHIAKQQTHASDKSLGVSVEGQLELKKPRK